MYRPGPDAARTVGAHERHPDHRHAALGRRQRGAGTAARVGADHYVNALLSPTTYWWLGLPAVLGVPTLFGVLRKELSLLMIYQALGSFKVGHYLDQVQIMTFLLFLTFYVPRISTFAVMLNTTGRRDALFSVSLSVAVALLVG